MYRVHCTVYRIKCTVYRVCCTVYKVQCMMYLEQCTPCTMYGVQCKTFVHGTARSSGDPYSLGDQAFLTSCVCAYACVRTCVRARVCNGCTVISQGATPHTSDRRVLPCGQRRLTFNHGNSTTRKQHGVRCTVYTICGVQCTLFTMCTLYFVYILYTMYGVRCTMYNVHQTFERERELERERRRERDFNRTIWNNRILSICSESPISLYLSLFFSLSLFLNIKIIFILLYDKLHTPSHIYTYTITHT